MADWSLIETTVAAWLTAITGLPTRWAGRPEQPTFTSTGYLFLSIPSVTVKGNPTLGETYNSGPDTITYTQSQALEFTLGIQIRTQRQSVDNDAKHYASLIRDRLFLRQTTSEVLDAAGVAVQRILGDTPVMSRLDDRALSVHQLDIRMNAVSNVNDTPVETIRTTKDTEAQIPEGNTVWTGDITIG